MCKRLRYIDSAGGSASREDSEEEDCEEDHDVLLPMALSLGQGKQNGLKARAALARFRCHRTHRKKRTTSKIGRS